MKKIKRFSAIILAVVMLFSLASCALVNTSETDITTDNIKIGVLLTDTADSTVGTAGICNTMISRLAGLGYGIKEDRFKKVESVDPSNADSVAAAFKTLVNYECNMIIVSDPAFMKSTLEVADQNKGIAFFVFNGQSNGKNVFGYKANITAAAYLSGIAAGLKATELKVPQVGYILKSDKDYSTLNAFYKGAKSVNAKITASVVVASDDIAADAQKLVKKGCVVLASDIQNEAIAKTAAENDIFFCDFGTDTFTGEDYEKAYLCAPIYDFTQYFIDTIKAIVDFEAPEDSAVSSVELMIQQGLIKEFNGGFAAGTTYLSAVNADNAAEGTNETIKAVSENLANGSLKFELSASKLEKGITIEK